MAYERMEVNRWQHTRWLGLKMIEPYLKKDSHITVMDILPLPGDPGRQEITQDERLRFERRKQMLKAKGHL